MDLPTVGTDHYGAQPLAKLLLPCRTRRRRSSGNVMNKFETLQKVLTRLPAWVRRRSLDARTRCRVLASQCHKPGAIFFIVLIDRHRVSLRIDIEDAELIQIRSGNRTTQGNFELQSVPSGTFQNLERNDFDFVPRTRIASPRVRGTVANLALTRIRIIREANADYLAQHDRRVLPVVFRSSWTAATPRC